MLQGCAVIPKSVNPEHIAQFKEIDLLGGIHTSSSFDGHEDPPMTSGGDGQGTGRVPNGGQTIGKVWSRDDDLGVLGLEAALADGHKYCWDPVGIR